MVSLAAWLNSEKVTSVTPAEQDERTGDLVAVGNIKLLTKASWPSEKCCQPLFSQILKR